MRTRFVQSKRLLNKIVYADCKLWLDEVSIVGTLWYMAPELVAGYVNYAADKEIHLAFDPVAADWWSVGAVLFEAATGSLLMAPQQTDSVQNADSTAEQSAMDKEAVCSRRANVMHDQHQQWQVKLQYLHSLMSWLDSTCSLWLAQP